MENSFNFDQKKKLYEIEIRLAAKLKSSTREERVKLYSEVYNELFERVPDHPQILRKNDADYQARELAKKVKLLKKFIKEDHTFLEIGAGDCCLSAEIAKQVSRVFAIDVSASITEGRDFPSNFRLIISDGTSIPVDNSSVDIAYSNQLMEHLHEEDALIQLRNIYDALAEGGMYICITPNRLSGPHDVSKYFDKVACGFHLKEYSHSELSIIFKRVGFRKVFAFFLLRNRIVRLPLFIYKLFEGFLRILPYPVRKKISGLRPVRLFLGIRIAAAK